MLCEGPVTVLCVLRVGVGGSDEWTAKRCYAKAQSPRAELCVPVLCVLCVRVLCVLCVCVRGSDELTAKPCHAKAQASRAEL